MVTVSFDELELNAVLASLDDRIKAMSRQLASLSEQPPSASRDFAIDTTREAIRHALRSQLNIAAALPDEDHPADATFATVDERCDRCGADGYSRHWIYCPNFPRPAVVLSGIEQYQVESR